MRVFLNRSVARNASGVVAWAPIVGAIPNGPGILVSVGMTVLITVVPVMPIVFASTLIKIGMAVVTLLVSAEDCNIHRNGPAGVGSCDHAVADVSG